MVREEGLGGGARLAVHGAIGVSLDACLVVPRVEHAHSIGVHSTSGLHKDKDDVAMLGECIVIVALVRGHIASAGGMVERRHPSVPALRAAEGEVSRMLGRAAEGDMGPLVGRVRPALRAGAVAERLLLPARRPALGLVKRVATASTSMMSGTCPSLAHAVRRAASARASGEPLPLSPSDSVAEVTAARAL